MNVLAPDLQTTIRILLGKGLSQREIGRNTGIDRKTIRRYARLFERLPCEETGHSESPAVRDVATGSGEVWGENPRPRPPVPQVELPRPVRSGCEDHREWIERQLRSGHNAMAIYQDLVELLRFTHRCNSVKRFVRGLKTKDPQPYDRLEFLMAEDAQVDYGRGATTLDGNGKHRRLRLFVMTWTLTVIGSLQTASRWCPH